MLPLVVWLVLIGLIVAVRILVTFRWFREWMHSLAKRLGAWLLARFDSPEPVDEVAEEMRAVIRADRLQADLRRLRRIIATDSAMSATRQMANRMAYAIVIGEWERHLRDGYPTFTEASLVRASAPGPGDLSWSASPVRYASRVPQVEVLEIGWRR